MPPQTSPLFALLTPLLQSLRLTSLPSRHAIKPTTAALLQSPTKPQRTFTTTNPLLAGRPVVKKRSNADQRIALIRYHLQHPKTPRPLRLSRMRALRHWTIHRAWMLMRRKRLESESGELHRMYQAQHAACEELRTMDSPETKGAGRLYRIAMEKKGVFGHGGIPIEYARWQVDTPGKEAWNHGWKR